MEIIQSIRFWQTILNYYVTLKCLNLAGLQNMNTSELKPKYLGCPLVQKFEITHYIGQQVYWERYIKHNMLTKVVEWQLAPLFCIVGSLVKLVWAGIGRTVISCFVSSVLKEDC